MQSPEGIMPDALIDRTRRQDALNWLLGQPLPGLQKVQLWQGWAATVGTGVAPREQIVLEDSGI
jgi:hypothetical protein